MQTLIHKNISTFILVYFNCIDIVQGLFTRLSIFRKSEDMRMDITLVGSERKKKSNYR